MMQTVLAEASAGDVTTLSMEDLWRELEDGFAHTAHGIMRMAMAWRELERRGVDMTQRRAGLSAYLSAVAVGRLRPEAVVRLAGNRLALRAIAALTLDEQKRLLDAGSVAVVENGETHDVQLHRLTAAQARRAIDPTTGTVIPPAEQRAARQRRRPETRSMRIVIALSESEHLRLQEEARRTNRTAASLVVQCLRNEKVI